MKWLMILFLAVFLIAGVYASCNEAQIDINTASAEDLDKIIWVGPSTANNIISYRKTNIFDSLDELINVSGIGEKKLADIKEQELACVGKEQEPEETSEEWVEGNETEEDSNETEQEGEEESNPEEDYTPINTEKRENLALKIIELTPNSKSIKSEDNKEILRRNLAFAGIITFCVVFGGALFLLNIRKRKNELN